MPPSVTAISCCETLCAIALSGAAWGALPGIADSPRPGPLPRAWAGWSNDSFGMEIGANTDDHRTNAIAFGLRLGERWVVNADHSMLTDRTVAKPMRSDQISGTVGRLLADDAVAGPGRWWMAVGAGGRLTGDYGGQEAQDDWHDVLGYARVSQTYDRSAREGLAYASGHWLWVDDGRVDSGHLLAGRFGIDVSLATLATTGGEVLGTAGIDLVLLGMDGSFRFGVRGAANAGTSPNVTASHVADQESGMWFTYGISAGGWFLDGGWDPDSQSTMGTIGWMWGRTPSRDHAADVTEMEGLLGIYQGYSIGFQYRWQPAWLRRAGAIGRRLSLLADYRFGRYPGVDWPGNTVVVRQPLAGIDCAIVPPGEGWSLVPFVYVGVGVRHERIRVVDDPARFPDQSAARGVVQGGAGLRLSWGRRAPGDQVTRYGLSLVYDAWLPVGNATAAGLSGSDTYQNPNASFGARLSASVPW